ncbi:MAG: hypothetical protein GY834_03540 [Bacteroidetes bacterium]|nr:hypothetical protein [Bacteroidota bacterium]
MNKDLEDYDCESIELKTPEGKSPIFFVNLTAKIKERLNSKKSRTVTAEKIVVKGTLEQIYKSDQTKKRFLRYFFKDDSASKKKVSEFDLNKVTISNVEIIRGLGYGIKSD